MRGAFSATALALALLIAPRPLAQEAADSALARGAAPGDTLTPGVLSGDSLATDSLAGTALSDSARAVLDSAAVAAFADTTAALAETALGRGTPVLFFGAEVFSVWGGLGPLAPEARAARVTERLEAIARNRDLDLSGLRVVDGNDLTVVRLGELIVMSVTDEDAAGRGLSRREAAEAYAREIREAVERYRETATLRGVARGAALTAGLLLALLLALRGLGRIYAWLDRRSARLRRRLLRPVRIGTMEVVGRDDVARAGRALARLARLAVSLVLVYLFLTTAFGLFPWTQAWSEQLLQYALAPLRELGRIVLDGAPNLLAIAVIVVVMRWVIGISDYLFHQVESGQASLAGFHDELAEPTRKIAKFLLIILAVMLIYPYTPIAESRVFQGLTVFLGVLFSLGSSTAISNVVAGVVLTYTRAFRVGDRVRVGDTFGDVVEKTFLVTRIRTPKNEDVAVPNATVLSNHIINYTRMSREGDGVILHTGVTIGYDVPWPEVHALLLRAARGTPGIQATPPPFVLQTSLGDFSVAYELNAYTHEVTRMAALYSEMHRRIQDAFAEAGVEILSPTYHARRDAPSTVPDWARLRGEAAPEGTGAPEASGDGAASGDA